MKFFTVPQCVPVVTIRPVMKYFINLTIIINTVVALQSPHATTITIVAAASSSSTNNNNNHDNNTIIMPLKEEKKNVLVLGATGNTGKHVVQQLLDYNNNDNDDDNNNNNDNVLYTVQVIVRSKQRFLDTLPKSTSKIATKSENENIDDPVLSVIEGSILDIPNTELDTYVTKADSIVICLGHLLSFAGIYGHPRRLVHDSTKRITDSIQRINSNDNTNNSNNYKKRQIILMNSDGVVGPNDTKLSFIEQCIFTIIQYLLPPHNDNVYAANFLYKSIGSTNTDNIEWTIVRPCNLLDNNATDESNSANTNTNSSNSTNYIVLTNPPGTTILFEYRTVYRSIVAQFMVHLITQSSVWEQWKFKFPYIENTIQQSDKDSKQKVTTTTTVSNNNDDDKNNNREL